MSVWSVESVKSTVGLLRVPLEAENVLGNDVALDLVRARVNRGLAHVKVPERTVFGRVERFVRGRFHHERRDRLLDLGARDLDEGGFGAGPLTGTLGRKRTQLRVRKCGQLDFHRREAFGEPLVVENGRTVRALAACDAPQTF